MSSPLHYFQKLWTIFCAQRVTTQMESECAACTQPNKQRRKTSFPDVLPTTPATLFSISLQRLSFECYVRARTINCRNGKSGKGRFHVVALEILLGGKKRLFFFSFFFSVIRSRYAYAPHSQNVAVIVGMGPFMCAVPEIYHTGTEVNDKNNLFYFGWSVGGVGGRSHSIRHLLMRVWRHSDNGTKIALREM